MKFVKDKEYYESLDKRTKEYKEWKAHQQEEKLAGDVVEDIAKATGLDKVVQKAAERLGYKDCGCSSRKEKLNEWHRKLKKQFKWKRQPKPLTEQEYVDLVEFFSVSRARISNQEQELVYGIYNRVFDEVRRPSQCLACYKEVTNKLQRLIRAHQDG